MMRRKYVPVAVRRQRMHKKIKALKKQGKAIDPVEIQGKAIANNFWGKLWCEHIEIFSDYSSRLPRGRTYVRNGSVCHLEVCEGVVKALVSGSELYNVEIVVSLLPKEKWEGLKKHCSGKVGSLLELLQGKISQHVMEVVANPHEGLFPNEVEVDFTCSCPDWAGMCKHIAASLYAVGSRLDERPDLLFLLRGVDPSQLIQANFSCDAASQDEVLSDQELEDIFGIDLEPTAHNKVMKEERALSRISHTHCSNKGQTVLQDGSEVNDGKVCKLCRKDFLKSDSKTDVQIYPALCEKCGLSEFDKIDVITGEQVRMLRKTAGMNVKDFAKVLGIAQASIYRWEKVKGRIGLRDEKEKKLRSFARKCSKKIENKT